MKIIKTLILFIVLFCTNTFHIRITGSLDINCTRLITLIVPPNFPTSVLLNVMAEIETGGLHQFGWVLNYLKANI